MKTTAVVFISLPGVLLWVPLAQVSARRWVNHYIDVIMGAMASQITGASIVYSAVSSGADQRKHQGSPSLAFVMRIHRWPVNSPHKGPVTRKIFPFDDVKLNLLKLNDDKTELLVITSRPSTSESLHISINVGDQYISPSEEPPKNLGVIFYSTCSLKDHVSNVCRSINFNLYSIGKIRKYLDRPTVEKLVNATMTSRLDYCNSLMFGIPK